MNKNKLKNKEYSLYEKRIAVMTAVGFIVNSLTTTGTTIQTADGWSGTNVVGNNGVYDITTSNIKGENALNRFKQFELSPNNIANMYFGQKNTTGVNNLFNFVDSQIKIDGVVNAIKENKIGGNLYFLSSSGMIVGNTGVINAGALYALTPSDGEYKRILENWTDESKFKQDIPKIQSGQIPLNSKGTITVRGQINATNHIGLYGAKVEIGNVGATGDSGQVPEKNLVTGVTDFKNLVNVNGIKSGIDEKNLVATKTGDGDIVLVARADTPNENIVDQIFNDSLEEIISVDNLLTENVEAGVTINGGIEASGDVDISAEATNGTVLMLDSDGNKLYDSSQFSSTAAKVEIMEDGKIKGKNIDINATVENKYLELIGGSTNSTTGAQGSAGILGQIVKIDGSIGALKGDAEINIAKNASVEATENLNIKAKNDVALTLGASVSVQKSTWAKLMKAKDEVTGGTTKLGTFASLPAVGAAMGYTEGEAKVNIEGLLKSGKDMKIEASSSNELDINATAAVKSEIGGDSQNNFVMALGLAVGKNSSSINIKDATIESGGNLDINSTATNSLTSIVEVVAGNRNEASTSLNLVAYDSSSDINIENSKITSGGDTNIKSENIITDNKIISTNNAGKRKILLRLADKNLTAIKEQTEAQKLLNNIRGLTGLSGTEQGKKAGIGEKITVGAAMAFVGEENSSNINIQGTTIDSKKDLNINSKMEVQDTLISVAGDTVSYNKDKKDLIGAGVLYGQIGNTSSIMIDGQEQEGDTIESSTLNAQGNINIHSITEMKYDRVNKMVTELMNNITAIKNSLEELKKYASGEGIEEKFSDLEEQLRLLEDEVNRFKGQMVNVDLDSLFSEAGVYQAYDMIVQAQKVSTRLDAISAMLPQDFASFTTAISDTITSITEFANVGNYGNFSVRATTRNKVEEAEGASVGIAGAISITNLQNDSKVVIGTGSTLNAGKETNINSTNETEAVNVGGNIGELVIFANDGGSSEEGTAIGGSFIMQDFDTNNIIAIAEGAKLRGTNINISADNNIFNINSVLSAGKSAGNAINGMVSYSTGSINNIISIDDEVLLETTGNETEDTTDDKIDIEANSDTFVVNVAGGLAKSENIGVGMGVAINEFDVTNKIEIKDNDANEELVNLVKHQHKNKVLDVIKNASVGDLVFTDDEDDVENLNPNIGIFDGSELNIEKQDTGINTNKLAAETITTGEINSVSVAGAFSSKNEGEEEEEGIFSSLKKNFDSKTNNFNSKIDSLIGKFNNNGAVNSLMNKGSSLNKNGSTSGAKAGETSINNNVDNTGSTKPTLNIAGAGSSSTNLIDNITKTEIDGIDITLRGDNSSIDVSAKDESFIGAWSGASAINWISKKGTTASSGTGVGVHGAVGINIIDRETVAAIKNSNIKNVLNIDVDAINSSVTTAAGLGLGLSKNNAAGNKNYQGGASVSLNDITHRTDALLENINTSGDKQTDVDIDALESGIQVTGGVNINVGQSSGAAGAAVTVANINNTVNAGIKGGNLQNINNIDVDGTLDITQVTAAAAIGATSQQGSIGVFEGAVVYNGTSNIVNSFIDGTSIDALGDINVTAGDTNPSSEKNRYLDVLTDLGIDATGEGYYNGLETGLTGEEEKTEIENNKSGSTIVTGAMSVAGSNSNALGAGVAISDIKNSFTSEIKGSENNIIKADEVNVSAAADTFIVGAAGGVGVGKDTFGGMGSVSWEELTNDVASKISGVNITARKVDVSSQNTTFEVNSAGQVTYGGKAAAGAVLAYTNIKNSSSAGIEGAAISLTSKDNDKSVDIVATSKVENYTIGAGASASSNVAVAGTIVVAQGGNTTSATITDTEIKDIDSLNTIATDENKVYTIAGTIAGSGTAAVGGSGAYSELEENSVLAAINSSNIKTSPIGNINIAATDTTKFYTIGAGVGGAGTVAVEGAAAISQIDKKVNASMENTNINSENDEEEREANLNIIAQSSGEITSNASVIAGSGTAGVGAGTAVNIIDQSIGATLSGGTQKDIKDVLVKSKSLANITTIGIGGAGAGTAGIAGSIAVNKIVNNTTTDIDGIEMIADGSVGALSESDDIISNYAGTLALAGTAAIGVSVSVNEISGNTVASINNSTITANGNGEGVKTHGDIADDSIIDSIIDKETAQLGNNLADKREESITNGIAVDSSSTHTLKSLLANGGLGGIAAVNGTVNVNQINGTTKANVSDSALTSTKALNIKSSDYTNSSGIVGSASLGGNAGIGASSDTNLVGRSVNTELIGSSLEGDNIDIGAISKQGISSFGIGVGGAITGAGVAGTVSVVDLKGNTSVNIDNTDIISANNILINSNHSGVISLGSGSLGVGATGVGVGAGISVVKDENKTDITIDESEITAEKTIDIAAENSSKIQTAITSAGVAGIGAGVAGTVSINNITNNVATKISNSVITSNSENISLKSKNNLDASLISAGGAAGFVGVGAVVNVNTIDSSVITDVSDTDISANNGAIEITADEIRNMEQIFANVAGGAAAIGGNVIINNFGTAVDGSIKVSDNLSIDGAYAQANGTQENKFDDRVSGIFDGFEITDENYKVEGSKGGTSNTNNTGIKVNISDNSNIGGNTVDIVSNEINNIDVVGGGGSIGVVSASGSVAITNINRNMGINISNSDINSVDKLNIGTKTSGNINLEVYQGSVGLAGLGAAYAGINSEGEALIDISSNSNLTSKKDLDIFAEDTVDIEATSTGLSGGIIAAGAIISEVENNGNIGVTIENVKIKAENNGNVKAKKENEINSEAIGGSVGIASGIGVSSKAKDGGTIKVEMLKANEINGEELNIQAINNLAVNAKTGSIAAGALVGVGASIAEAETSSNTIVSTENGTKLIGDTIKIEAEISGIDGKEHTVSAETESVGGGGIAGVDSNLAKVVNRSSSQLNLNGINFSGKNSSQIKDLIMTSRNNTKLKADVDSISFGGIFTSGVNTAEIDNSGKSFINVSNSEKSDVENLKIEGVTNSENILVSNGNGGGGLAAGSAIVESKVNTTSDVNVGGTWNVSNLFEATATDNIEVSINADSTRGGFIGANGITISNEVKNDESTRVKIIDGTTITGLGQVNIESKNDIDVDIEAAGAAYGGAGFADVVVKNSVDKKTAVEIGKANITTDKEQKYQAFTDADILVKNKIDAAGAIAGTTGKIENTLNTKNNISLTKDGHLETTKYDQDIILAASDKIKDIVEGIAETSGAGGASKADVKSNLARENRIDVNGDILSYNDVKLYTGMDKNEKSSSVDYRALAHSYTHGAFTGADPILGTNISVKNQVVTGTDSDIKSVRNIDVEANSGENRIERAVQKYTWYSQENSSDYVTTASGESNENINSEDNYADIQGNMEAGIYANQVITIDGVVDLNKDINGKTDIVDADVISKPKLTYGEGTNIDVETGIEDYANNLIKRYNEICELLKNYSDEKSAAYQGYQAEKARILNTMISLGLAEEVTFDDGSKAIVPIGKLDVQYVKISDIVASGGNITINSGNIKNVQEGIDSGRIKANGNPQISITNNSNLYLKVGDIRILEKGGVISFNNSVLKDTSLEEKSVINIENNWNSTLKVEDKSGNKQDVKVLSTIEVTGDIENLIGDINITNRGGDILMQGEEIGDSTNIVAGGNLNLSATGSISQAYAEGITNIGTTPEEAWKEFMQSTKDEALKDNNLQNDQNDNFYRGTGVRGSTTSGIIAGGEIYLNGEVINVNGKVQSGFDKYEVIINGDTIGYNNQKVSDLIASYDKNWDNNGGTITENNLKDYILTKGGNKYDEQTGTFYYEPATYYDPSTKQVVVENINVGGGKVYITGRVISTGNGEITALDGAANINIDNNTNNDLRIGTIRNSDVQGLISINDAQKNIVTEYYRDKTVTKEITNQRDENGSYIYNVRETLADGTERYYTPDKGMRYNWTEGSETGISSTYTQSKDFYFWGGLRLSMDQVIRDNTSKPKETEVLDKTGKPVGSFISQDTNNNSDFSMNFTNKAGNEKEIVGKRSWTEYHDFLHSSGTDYYEWTEKGITEQTYTGSIKADRDIGIKFIGSENGNINIESNNNIELAGSITNARSTNTMAKGNTGNSMTNILSENGKIIETAGSITADTFELKGKNGIENIVINGIGDTVNLSANTADGNIDIEVRNNVILGELVGKDRVELSAYGNISQQNRETAGVVGNRIDLVSEIGGIDLIVDSGDTPLVGGDTLSASINASAAKDISLKESDGDMRIGKIYSSQGDVTLETDGALVDALPTGEHVENTSTQEMINRWKEAGLIDSEELRNEKEQQYKEYSDGVKAEYAEYLELKSQTLEEGSVEAQKLAKLNEKYSNYADAEDYLSNSTEGQNQLKLKNSGGKWDQNQLLYAIQDSMVNQEGGSTQKEIKEPNIKGNNITIKAGKGVGVDKEETVVDLTTLKENNYEGLKKLASSEAADVIWNQEEGIATIREKNPIGIQMTNSEGKLNVEANDNIYLAARVEENGNPDVNTLYVENINTTGNIRLLGTGGVFNVSQDGTNFTGKDLILEGGKGDLGELEKALTMNISGTLIARSDGNIYLNQTAGDLNVAAIYGGGVVNLKSAGNIFSTNVVLDKYGNEESAGNTSGTSEEDSDLILGYINAEKGIVLDAQKDIGTAEQGINIRNGKEYAVDAKGENIYLQGKKDGTLLLGTLDAQENIEIESEDSITTSETIKGRNITFVAENNITLGTEQQDTNLTSDKLNLNAKNGSIAQNERDTVISKDVIASANTGIKLDSNKNKFDSINLENNSNDILVNNSGENGLNVTFNKGTNAGNIIINNVTGNMNIKGSNGSINATGENDLIFNNENGDITIEENNNLTAGKDISIVTNKGNINTNNSEIIANSNVTLETLVGDILAAGNIEATLGDIDVSSAESGNIGVTGSLTAGNSIDVLGNQGAINLTKGAKEYLVKSGAETTILTESGDIGLSGDILSGKDLLISTTLGDITHDTNIVSGGEGRVETKETGDITINNMTTENDLYLTTKVGDINANELRSINGSVYVSSANRGNIKARDIDAYAMANIFTKSGDITIDNLSANNDVDIVTENGKIVSSGSLKSINDSMNIYSAKGDIDLNDVYAKDENRVTAKDGNIYIKKINGDYVIITLGKKDKEMKVDETIVGKGAILSSNDITVKNLSQREGEKSLVEITFNNSEDNQDSPIKNIELHAKGIENGIKINQLWVHDAYITTDREILQFPKLVVTGKGNFANSSTTVTVYGEDSAFDTSNIHIWNDADKKEWIVLNFLPERQMIYTDGMLLRLQDGYKVYEQRISANDYMIDHLHDYLTTEHKLNEIKDSFTYLYKPYLQYNLIDNNTESEEEEKDLEVVKTEDGDIVIQEKR